MSAVYSRGFFAINICGCDLLIENAALIPKQREPFVDEKKPFIAFNQCPAKNRYP